jgi:hypothetical protein
MMLQRLTALPNHKITSNKIDVIIFSKILAATKLPL